MTKSVTKETKMGRPTEYTVGKADEIIKRIMNGESVVKICKDDHMPNRSTIYEWVAHNAHFSDRYTQALQHRTHMLAEERHDILNDAIAQLGCLPDGVNANVYGALIKEKMRIIEWDAERLAAKKYKPKTDDMDVSDKPVSRIQLEVVGANHND